MDINPSIAHVLHRADDLVPQPLISACVNVHWKVGSGQTLEMQVGARGKGWAQVWVGRRVCDVSENNWEDDQAWVDEPVLDRQLPASVIFKWRTVCWLVSMDGMDPV